MKSHCLVLSLFFLVHPFLVIFHHLLHIVLNSINLFLSLYLLYLWLWLLILIFIVWLAIMVFSPIQFDLFRGYLQSKIRPFNLISIKFPPILTFLRMFLPFYLLIISIIFHSIEELPTILWLSIIYRIISIIPLIPWQKFIPNLITPQSIPISDYNHQMFSSSECHINSSLILHKTYIFLIISSNSRYNNYIFFLPLEWIHSIDHNPIHWIIFIFFVRLLVTQEILFFWDFGLVGILGLFGGVLFCRGWIFGRFGLFVFFSVFVMLDIF